MDSMADPATWSPTINQLLEKGTVGLGPYDLELDYDYWTYCRNKWSLYIRFHALT